jgi:hypothetical protein
MGNGHDDGRDLRDDAFLIMSHSFIICTETDSDLYAVDGVAVVTLGRSSSHTFRAQTLPLSRPSPRRTARNC